MPRAGGRAVDPADAGEVTQPQEPALTLHVARRAILRGQAGDLRVELVVRSAPLLGRRRRALGHRDAAVILVPLPALEEHGVRLPAPATAPARPRRSPRAARRRPP